MKKEGIKIRLEYAGISPKSKKMERAVESIYDLISRIKVRRGDPSRCPRCGRSSMMCVQYH